MHNLYKEHLDSFFESSIYFKGRLMHLLNFNSNYTKTLLKNKYDEDLIGSILSIRDLSRMNGDENFNYPNLHPLDHVFELNSKNIDKENLEAEFFICASVLCQLFESFERFLIDIIQQKLVLELQFDNPLNLLFDKKISSPEKLRITIKEVGSQNNKGGYLKLIRKISPYYTSVEKNNFRKLELNDWFDIYVTFRHSATHNQRRIKEEIILKYHKSKGVILNSYFTNNIDKSNNYVINLNRETTEKNIDLLCEFAFIIYKSMSIDNNLEWDFLKKI